MSASRLTIAYPIHIKIRLDIVLGKQDAVAMRHILHKYVMQGRTMSYAGLDVNQVETLCSAMELAYEYASVFDDASARTVLQECIFKLGVDNW
jgi:hypothetical protein